MFSWHVTPGPAHPERVRVKLEARGDDTEVVVVHERILDDALRAGHQRGWEGCLAGLDRYLLAFAGR